MKNNKGITLIALIITIVIMLILVGVSVTTALNGGLFDTARESVNETEKIQDERELLAAITRCIGVDGTVNYTRLEANLPEGFEKVKDGLTGLYRSASGNKYIVFDNGDIIDGNIAYLNIEDGNIDLYSDGYKQYTGNLQNNKNNLTEYTGPYLITGTTEANAVNVMEEGTYDITIRDLNIDLSSSTSNISAFNANKGSKAQGCMVNVTLEGNNLLYSYGMAGLHFCGGSANTEVETNRSTLTIKGEGYLDAECKAGYGGSGIGGCYSGAPVCDIVIESGNITAKGLAHGCGIGPGLRQQSGNVTINNGNIYAKGGRYAGISAKHLTINEGSIEAYGLVDMNALNAERVIIDGGTVSAINTYGLAGICGKEKITINGGTIIAQSQKYNNQYYNPGIGISVDGGSTPTEEQIASVNVEINGGNIKSIGTYPIGARNSRSICTQFKYFRK